MADDNSDIHGYSKDRRKYHTEMSSKPATTLKTKRTLDKAYSDRDRPEIITFLTIANNDFNHQKERIYQSVKNDKNHFNMINYPIQCPSPVPVLNDLTLEDDNNKQDKVPMFPPLTPKSATMKKPFLTSMPKIEPSMNSISSGSDQPVKIEMPYISKTRKQKVH
ncbi:unnamed protein product [Adineta steineri]|uniref:Uncharacterized protein n=1 Tax=Adineta steineri TaxID=433720 RepID=A0A814E4D8_9BILA|nr:unnamed protein product [Adineta steineri]